VKSRPKKSCIGKRRTATNGDMLRRVGQGHSGALVGTIPTPPASCPLARCSVVLSGYWFGISEASYRSASWYVTLSRACESYLDRLILADHRTQRRDSRTSLCAFGTETRLEGRTDDHVDGKWTAGSLILYRVSRLGCVHRFHGWGTWRLLSS
jgi:hypothetical protein